MDGGVALQLIWTVVIILFDFLFNTTISEFGNLTVGWILVVLLVFNLVVRFLLNIPSFKEGDD